MGNFSGNYFQTLSCKANFNNLPGYKEHFDENIYRLLAS